MPQDMSWFLSNANNLVAVVVAIVTSYSYFKVFNLRLQSLVIADCIIREYGQLQHLVYAYIT